MLKPLEKKEIRAVVLAETRELLLELSADEVVLKGPEHLHELGLNSLTLARLIVQLERELGFDPFAVELASVADIRSVDDLIGAYESASAAIAGASQSG